MEDGKTCIHVILVIWKKEVGICWICLKTAIVYATMPVTFYIIGFLCVCCTVHSL